MLKSKGHPRGKEAIKNILSGDGLQKEFGKRVLCRIEDKVRFHINEDREGILRDSPIVTGTLGGYSRLMKVRAYVWPFQRKRQRVLLKRNTCGVV